jgi:hypothetical protein
MNLRSHRSIGPVFCHRVRWRRAAVIETHPGPTTPTTTSTMPVASDAGKAIKTMRTTPVRALYIHCWMGDRKPVRVADKRFDIVAPRRELA